MSLEIFPELATFAGHPFPRGYPVNDHVILYAPEDNLAGAFAHLVNSAAHSLAVCIPSFDDNTVATAVLRKLQDDKVYVLLVLGSTEATGPHWAQLLQAANSQSNTVVIGRSPDLPPLAVVDGLDSVNGSASMLTFARHPLVASKERTRVDRIAEELRTRQSKREEL